MIGPTIVTVTVNPTVDIASDAEAIRPIHKIRTSAEAQHPGGGGVNVARVIHELGGPVRAIILSGGFPGRFLEELLAEEEVLFRAIPIQGRTRISYTVHDCGSGQEYRFVPEGTQVAEPEWRAVLQALEDGDAGWIVGSGSLPPGIPDDFYAQMAELAHRRGCPFALDTSGAALRRGLAAGGLALVKPSLGEFERLIGKQLRWREDLERAALDMVHEGKAQRIAVTMGRDGAMLACERGVFHEPQIEVEVRGAVGAGDSFMGAMVLALSRGATDDDAFAWGMAAGAAAVMHSGTAQPSRAEVEALHASLRARH